MAGEIGVVVNVTAHHYGQATADTLKRNAEKIAGDSADHLVSATTRREPIRTGFLRGSTKARTLSKYQRHVMVGAFYGVYVNYGTRNMRPQPFWEPSIEETKVRLRRDLQKVFKP